MSETSWAVILYSHQSKGEIERVVKHLRNNKTADYGGTSVRDDENQRHLNVGLATGKVHGGFYN